MPMFQDVAKVVLGGGVDPFGVVGALTKVLGVAINSTGDAARTGNLQDLEQETRKQELTMKMQERQARVAQELALAYRIRTAEEIEVEEHFEGRGQGSAGLKAEDAGVTVGVAGSGERVTRRIYRLKGWSPDVVVTLPALTSDSEEQREGT